MFQAKENFLDRVEQSFILFKDNLIALSLPFIIFNLFSTVIIPVFCMNIVLGYIPLDKLVSGGGQNTSIVVALVVSIGFLLAVSYALLLIPFQIGLIKNIKQAIYLEIITPKENILYGFRSLRELIFKTYWYMFAYVLLIPAIIFIVGGFLLIGGLAQGGDISNILSIVGYIVMGSSLFIGMFFLIYKGTKAKFAIISTIEKENFSKENFISSLKLSDGKWWRIFWNLVGVGILGGLIVGIISKIGGIFVLVGGNNTSYLSLLQQGNITSEDIQSIVEGFTQFSLISFMNSIFQNILATLLAVFITIFTYILFLQLEKESGKTTSQEGKKTREIIEEL